MHRREAEPQRYPRRNSTLLMPDSFNVASSFFDHGWSHIDADHLPRRRNHAGGNQAVNAGAAADVQDLFARLQCSQAEGISGARERFNGCIVYAG